MSLTVIVLAAGLGDCMVSDLPKVLHPLAGKPMVGHVADAASCLKPDLLVIVAGDGTDQVRRAGGEEVAYVVYEPQEGRWAMAPALQRAEGVAAGRSSTVLVLFGDRPLLQAETLRQAVDHHLSQGAMLTVLTFPPLNPAGGVLAADGRRVAPLLDRGNATLRPSGQAAEQSALGEANVGAFIARDDWLWPGLSRLALLAGPGDQRPLAQRMVAAAAQGERVEALLALDSLEGLAVNDRRALAAAEAEMRRRINDRWMLAGVTLIDPATTYIEAGVEIGADTVVWPQTLLQGQTRIGRACVIGPGSIIRESSVGDGCRVERSVVEQAVMEERCTIGPFGHLRRGAHLAEGAHLGNFGEVKNSYLGPGVKMGHMSYLGDATVGAGANIGAGTITCNYDGERKHRTVIGAGAFIGSDTMLVAPVQVGEGARTGAGSVVTRDVPPGSLAYGVPARTEPPRPSEPSDPRPLSETEVV